MNHLINISLSFLQKNIIISDANLKILKYGLNILYSTFLGILGVILCGIILKSSIYSFLFLLGSLLASGQTTDFYYFIVRLDYLSVATMLKQISFV